MARPSDRVRSILNRVSTKPTVSSYVWGGVPSPLPWLILHGIYLLRLISPLQWVKFWTRSVKTRRPTTNQRPDFPSAFTEWYFIGVLAVAATGYGLRHSIATLPGAVSVPVMVVAVLLAVECTTWTIYYLLLRNFVENYYTIFHPAEYILTFPVVVLAQLFLLGLVSGRGLTDLVVDFVGNPQRGDAFGAATALLAVLYFGVAISVVLSSHPGIKTRTPQNMIIIGAGDVTRKRTIPALFSLGYDRDDVLVVTLDEPDRDPGPPPERRVRVVSVRDTRRVTERSLSERSPTVIASPTYAHFHQLVELANAGIPFAVEKPIVSNRSEREILRRNPGLMANGFALSYYTLEKSLPLTFLFEPLPIYAKFLRSDRLDLADGAEVAKLRAALGSTKSIRVAIVEDQARSPSGTDRLWTETPGTLRPFVETTIHPLLAIRRCAGSGDLRWHNCALGRYGPREREVNARFGESIAPTWLVANGAVGNLPISMEVGKYAPADRAVREAHVEFAHGRARADFDARRVEVEVEGEHAGWIGIDTERENGKYAPNYAVLMALFGEFVLRGWGAVRFDDYENQLTALADWDALCDAVEDVDVPVPLYDREPPPVRPTALP